LETKSFAVEVYVTANPVEVQVAVGALEDNGIEAGVRDLTARSYPFSVGLLAEQRVVVAEEAAEAARQVLEAALEDGALTDGSVIYPSA